MATEFPLKVEPESSSKPMGVGALRMCNILVESDSGPDEGRKVRSRSKDEGAAPGQFQWQRFRKRAKKEE
jgi:hypothetical protein